ncbi:MAG: hypothetical protein FJX46_06310 [Alphaproteobacteria bacterium]|nr:hypothetical protein [Alphaproteobacteria bacterium]
MRPYVYAFCFETADGEVFFRFPRFPEIVSAVKAGAYRRMSAAAKTAHAHDAVVAALQAIVHTRDDVPQPDDPAVTRAGGFVYLSVTEAMKLELYRLFRADGGSMAGFAKLLGRTETVARRLLNLRHNSRPQEIEAAIAAFDKRLVHDWRLEAAA